MSKMYVHMGTITRPHGIKGEICVDWYANSPELLRATFFLQAASEPMRKIVDAKVRMHKGRPLLTLPHVQDRNGAEALRGVRIYVARADLPTVEDDEAYLHDLIGFSVIDDATNTLIGELESVEFPSDAQMLWCIRAPGGQEILLPAVEEFLAGFDLEEGVIYVNPPQGLLDLYLSTDNA